MTDKVVEFLSQIGFTKDEIIEFYHVEPDGFYSDGEPFYGADELFAIILQEKIPVNPGNDQANSEIYWEEGWFSEPWRFRRSNFDIFQGKWYKVFQTRYKISEFKFTKSLRRVLKKNADLKTVIRPLSVTLEKSDLFDTHHRVQLGEPPHKTLFDIYRHVSDETPNIMELCVFKDDKLIACSIFESAANAMFSNLAFWDLSEAKRCLGTLTFLLEVEYALSKGMQYCYFGMFYAQNPNYYYKARFGGFELYDWDNDCWVAFGRPRIKEMLKQKLPRLKS
jgi:arginine-tRNA-protein transferase